MARPPQQIAIEIEIADIFCAAALDRSSGPKISMISGVAAVCELRGGGQADI
jgi:hypothetical protein